MGFLSRQRDPRRHEFQHEFRSYVQNTPHQLVARIELGNHGATPVEYFTIAGVQFVVIDTNVHGRTIVPMRDCFILSPAF